MIFEKSPEEVIAEKSFSLEEVLEFARLTRDYNPLHRGENGVVMGTHIAAYAEQQIKAATQNQGNEVIETRVRSHLRPGTPTLLIHHKDNEYLILDARTKKLLAEITLRQGDGVKLRNGTEPMFSLDYSLTHEEIDRLNNLIRREENEGLTHACAAAFAPPTFLHWQEEAMGMQEGVIGVIKSKQLAHVNPDDFKVIAYNPRSKEPRRQNGHFLYKFPAEIRSEGNLAYVLELIAFSRKEIPMEVFEYKRLS